MAGAESSANEGIQNARRVSQLDASELDNQIFELIKVQLGKTFKYLKPDLLLRYSPEIHAALRFLLWKFSVHSLEATVGQQLLDLRYQDVSSSAARGRQWMNKRQKILYALCFCGAPYLQERLPDLQALLRGGEFTRKLGSLVKWVLALVKLAGLVNFLVFLTRGNYQFIYEIFLGIRASYPRPVGVRQVGFEYMYREMLWHGFAEFLFFLLPMINFRRVKNTLSRHLLPQSMSTSSCDERDASDYRRCVVCGNWPTNPHHINCKHVFCFYCIQSNYLSDPGYTCPSCGKKVESSESIHPVSVKHTVSSAS